MNKAAGHVVVTVTAQGRIPCPFLFTLLYALCFVHTVSRLLCPRLSTSVARPAVQVVTHLCYSDFQDIMAAVDDMDGERRGGLGGGGRGSGVEWAIAVGYCCAWGG